jgi:hypothetical protein
VDFSLSQDTGQNSYNWRLHASVCPHCGLIADRQCAKGGLTYKEMVYIIADLTGLAIQEVYHHYGPRRREMGFGKIDFVGLDIPNSSRSRGESEKRGPRWVIPSNFLREKTSRMGTDNNVYIAVNRIRLM